VAFEKAHIKERNVDLLFEEWQWREKGIHFKESRLEFSATQKTTGVLSVMGLGIDAWSYTDG
jgi:hypothetical protein